MKNILERVGNHWNRSTVKKAARKWIGLICCASMLAGTCSAALPGQAVERKTVCGKEEHEHTSECYTRELVCGQEESEGHQHTDECYEDVLTCGKEVHVHTEDCYAQEEADEKDGGETADAAVTEDASTEEAAEKASNEKNADDGAEESQTGAEDEEAVEGEASQPASDTPGNDGKDDAAEAADTDGTAADEDADKKDPAADQTKTADDAAGKSGKDAGEAKEAKPEKLEPLTFDELLTDKTGIYYLTEDGDADDLDDWERLTDDTVLEPEEDVILHIAYEIPAGKLNPTNAEAEYVLPLGIDMSEDEVRRVKEKDHTLYEGTERTADDNKESGEFTIEEETNDKGDVTERRLVIRFNEYAQKKAGGVKLADGTEKQAPEKLEGYLEITVSAEDLLALEKVEEKEPEENEAGFREYKLEWNDDSDLDTYITFNWEQPEDQHNDKAEEEEKKYYAGSLTFKGSDYAVTADFDESAKFPEGTSLKVSELQGADYDKYLEEAQKAVEDGKEVKGARFFDITFVDEDGAPIEPAGMVDIRIRYRSSKKIDEDTSVEGLHFTEEGTEPVEVETNGASENLVKEVTFQSDSFSVFGVLYTVDFEIVNPENGKTYTYSLKGGTSINLTELLVLLGIKNEDEVEKFVAEEVTDVKFSTPELVKVTHKGKFLGLFGTQDWLIESLQPFNTEETLTIMLKDGSMITVKVTDAQMVVVINFYESDGVTPAPATNGGYNYIVATNGSNVHDVCEITLDPTKATAMLDIRPGDSLYLIRYEGVNPQASVLSEHWWYDPTGTLKDKRDLNGAELGMYTVSVVDGTNYKAVKKTGYSATLNLVDRMQQNPVIPGQSDAPAITDETYVGAHVRNDQDVVVGYAIAKLSTSSDSNSVVFDKVMIFRENQSGTDNISYTDAKERGYYINDVVIRHYTGNQQIQNAPSYEQFTGSEWTSDASDGYTFVSREYLPQGNENSSKDSTGCVVTQRLADPTEYFVKVDCGNEPLIIPEEFKLYAKVNVNNGARYGFVELASDEGNSFKGQVTQWYNSDGTLADKQSINGHENNVSVVLHAVPKTQEINNPNMLNDSNALAVGGVIQTHQVVSYPSIPKDYDPSTETGVAQREIESDPGVKTVYTDYVYLEKNDDRMTDYSLETLLERYNIITICPNTESGHEYNSVEWGDGDFVFNQHTVGGILVRGDLIINTSNNIGGGDYATQPSAVGGALIGQCGQIIGGGQGHPGRNNPFYVGEVNKVIDGKVYVDGELVDFNTYGPTIANNDYVDWDALQASVIRHSRAMANSSTRTVTITNEGNQTISLKAGEKIKVVYADGVDPQKTRVTVELDMMNQDFEDLPGTVISFVGGGHHNIPKLETVNGNLPGSTDNGEGISVIYNFSEASDLTTWDGDPEYGHVIAPFADVVLPGSNYNGCVIANSCYSASEGHLSPYKGGTIVGFYGKVKTTKTVDGEVPNDRQVFKFAMKHLRNAVPESEYQEEIDKDKTQDQIMWDYIGTTTNNHGSVEFDKVPFYEAGKYYFLVYESTDKQYPDITLDTTKYIVEVNVVANPSGENEVLSVDSTSLKYYKVTNEQNLITVEHDEAAREYRATINPDAITSMEGNLTWENSILDTPIVFQNKEKKSGITIRKVVEGTDDQSAEFPFKLYVWFENTEAGSTSYTAYDGGVNANGESMSFESCTYQLNSEDPGHSAGFVNFNLTAATPITFVGLPVGVHYAFVEDVENMPTGYEFVSKTHDTGVVPDDGAPSEEVVFTNRYNLKKIEVTKIWKKTSGENDDWANNITIKLHKLGSGADTVYTYTVSKNETDSTITAQSTDTGAPKAEVTGDKDSGYKITFKQLDIGCDYYVTEEALEGYKTVYANDVSATGKAETRIEPKEDTDLKDRACDGEYIINIPEDAVTLPSAGGIGTTLFYIVGSILVIGAAVVLITRRRMNDQ